MAVVSKRAEVFDLMQMRYIYFCWFAQGIVRENGGHAVALHWSMRNLYGINPGEVTKDFQ